MQYVFFAMFQHHCEVASITVEEEDVNEAKAGDNVRLKLKNCEEEVRNRVPLHLADLHRR